MLNSNRSSKLLANLLQPTTAHQHQQSQQLVPPAAALQPPTAPASAKQQQKQRSILYSTASQRHSTPGGRAASTPHQKAAASKKKPRFSIKDTPTQPTPSALVTPAAKGHRSSAPLAAGVASGSRSLAALLGSSSAAAATPNKPATAAAAAADSSWTPLQQGPGPAAILQAGLFATPRNSSSKLPAPVKAAGAQQHTPGQPVTTPAAAAAAVTPAALFSGEDNPARTPADDAAAAGAGADAVTPQPAGSSGGDGSSHKGTKRRAADVNPLELMTASRQRQRAFLERLPAAAAGAAAGGGGAGLAGLQLAGVSVPLGANLSKVWQQLQDARKRQQDRLEENPDGDRGGIVMLACGGTSPRLHSGTFQT